MKVSLLLWILILTLEINEGKACPLNCSCKRIGAQLEWLKASCAGRLRDIKEIDVNRSSVQLAQLDLSKNEILAIESGIFKNLTNLRRLNLSANKISSLDERPFDGLENLERLDLSKNEITSIDAIAFRKLTRLKRLDLSTNKISTLEPNLFHDLTALDRLKLNQNELQTLKDGTFYGLNSLKQLDLSANSWMCDCNIYWFSNWVHNKSIKLSPPPKCSAPEALRGQPLKKLRLSDEIQCQNNSPMIEMLPDQNQVAFVGDSMHVKCRAPTITEDKTATINWLWNPTVQDTIDTENYTNPQTTLSNIKIENRHLADSGLVDSLLSIAPVAKEHNGHWNCQLISVHGNESKTISIIVISEDTEYCPSTVTRNNKGIYSWPRTVVGWKVELPCEGNQLASPLQILPRATYQCNETGKWESLSTDGCPFVSPTTKALEQFSKVNLSLTKGSVLETAKSFKNYTTDSSKLTDPVEINFISRTIENYLSFLHEEKELGSMLIDIVNILTNLPKEMLKAAQVAYKTCTHLVKSVETVTELAQSIQSHKKNMALEEFRVKRESFTGLTCTWYSNMDSDESEESKTLHCATNNKTALINVKNKLIQASIQLPGSLLRRLDGVAVAHHLMISMYSDNRLFPIITEGNNMDISSCVIGSKLIGVNVGNLSEPVVVTLRAPLYHVSGSRPRPAVWDIGNSKGWSTDGCQLSGSVKNLIVFRCDRLGYYGLLQDMSFLKDESRRLIRAKFKYSHPAIYVGSFIAMLSLTCASVTYMICHTFILMPKKVKHCLVNTWVAMASLCFLFTAGIQQTENFHTCQSIGLILHYLSLCSLLWMSVSASNMYKRLSKPETAAIPDDELPDQPIQKPLLGLYLVGWGIALIICGISGAINLREYASSAYCFLTSGPALAALFVPAVILLLYLIMLHLLIRCVIRNIDSNAQLSEGTQATENMDLELLEPNVITAGDRCSIQSTQTVTSEVEDLEHSQSAQLKGQIIVLILYLLTWISAASAVTKPLIPYMPYEESIFSVMYAISASSLGLFVLFFYGLARSDVRFQWLKMRCWLKKKRNRCCRTRSVSYTNPVIPAQTLVPTLAPVSNSQATQVVSDTNSNNSSRRTNKSRNGNPTKPVEANGPSTAAAKIANVNLVVLHRQQYRSNNSITTYTEPTLASMEMFYNPHQSGVARKFFKKQRRHMKNNNLGPRKQGDGGVTSDGGSCISIPRPAKIDAHMEKNMFSTSAKVNNTNIHVEMNPVSDGKNVNILSDSGGSVSEDRNIPMRFVIGQENASETKKVNNDGLARQRYAKASLNSDSEGKVEPEKQLRNVSQQCSLEYNSEVDAQMNSERSDHNLPEIGENMETTEENYRCSSVDKMSGKLDAWKKLNYSNSLYCLPIDYERAVTARNHGRSLNDVASLSSSKNCENDYSRPSLLDLNSLTSSHLYDQVHNSQRVINRSQQSLVEVNSLASENTYGQVQEAPTCSTSLLDINAGSDFQLSHLLLDNYDYNRRLERPTIRSRDLVAKDFNSLNDLTSVGKSVSTDLRRISDASPAMMMDSRNRVKGQHYVDLGEEEGYSDGSTSLNEKKETSV